MRFINTALLDPEMPSEQGAPDAEYVLNVTMVYQDAVTREWASEMETRVTRLVGPENIRADSWRIGDLARPAILEAAVRSAVNADVLVVAASAAGDLPEDLYVWCDIWLPRRLGRAGALVALIGLPDTASHHVLHASEYFQAVARKGGLDYFPQKRPLPAASHALFEMGTMAEIASLRTRVPAGMTAGAENRVQQFYGITG
jgi:hypothetical protein